ncbi:MAG TPA: sugar transferase [Candidatus Saccharimonadales bacterium]
MTERTPNPNKWLTSRTKRIMDICVSAGALVVTSPALVVAVAAKYFEDFKNPFFHQARLGRGGETFYIHKIRTLHGTADHQTVGHGPHDKRATRVGGPLRKYAIDEIPQLWNILKGDMSLFGARPINEADQQHMRAALGDEAYQD